MFASMIEIVLAAAVVGAASVYTKNKQTTLSVLFILMFAAFSYLGFLLSSAEIIYFHQLHWIVDVLRMIIVLAIMAAAVFSFMPVYGFFHSYSKYIWLSVALLFFFVGWHAGHWFGSWYMFIGIIVLFTACYVAGNTFQGMVHMRLRQNPYVSFLPFVVLLFFSILLLL
ncbi:hypothetical protein SAMN05192534_106103 [Alteribacillus persepolensis]|uniref:Uncharacterized protein n=1 Tax=Alteribacillus persepolensis TaxID=568899 RepID=A0A1G8CW15_9BACI|nr:hypothetical protein [Alteribacillus persepolensis]SDH49642.1 hypothetical protein SAMN05192534_106103 [Alteribacillus persepolensis]